MGSGKQQWRNSFIEFSDYYTNFIKRHIESELYNVLNDKVNIHNFEQWFMRLKSQNCPLNTYLDLILTVIQIYATGVDYSIIS